MYKYFRLQSEHILFISFALILFLFHHNMGNDYYWHIKAGELISIIGGIPSRDPFSFTTNGRPWVLHEWLFEYIFYHIHFLTGNYGVKFASSVAVSLSLYVTYRTAVSLSKNKLLSIMLLTAGFYLMFPFNMPRAQIFTYLFLALYVNILANIKFQKSYTQIYWLPLIMLLWVNIHGGYVIGMALMALFFILEVINRFFSIFEKSDIALVQSLYIGILLCTIATLANPYTYHHWFYPFYVTTLDAIKYINEWREIDFRTTRNQVYLIFVFGYFFVSSYKPKRPHLIEVVLPLGMVFMSFLSVRHIPVAILTLLPFYAKAIRECCTYLKPKNSHMKLPLKTLPIAGEKQKTGSDDIKEYAFNWIILITILMTAIAMHLATVKRINLLQGDSIPISAMEFIKNEGVTGNVFNHYDVGGYMIYMLYPESRVFIDGRADLYGNEIYADYRKIVNAGSGWEEVFNKYTIDYVVCYNIYNIVPALINTTEFKLVFRDATTSVFLRNNMKYRSIIEEVGYNYIVDKKFWK